MKTSHMTTGYAMSGGGARGVAHLGVLQALEEAGIRPQILSGTSAGAIVGALYAASYTPDEILKIIIKTKFFTSLRPALSFSGLLQMESLAAIFEEYLPATFETLNIPLIIVATDLDHGKAHYFNSGELIKPLLAASCIPGIFKPVVINDNRYVDGGIINNLPADPLIGKCDKIIGIHTNPIDHDFTGTNAKAIIERCMLMAISGNTIQRADMCHYYIEPPGLGKYSGLDLSKANELYNIAYNHTTDLLMKKPFAIK